MGTRFYYDVYEGNKIILDNVTTDEIQKHFGATYSEISYYTSGRAYYQGIYQIVRHGSGQPKALHRKNGGARTEMPEDWIKEWAEVCSRIRRKKACVN